MGLCYQCNPPEDHMIKEAGTSNGLFLQFNIEQQDYFLTEDFAQGSVGIKVSKLERLELIIFSKAFV